MKLKMLDLFCGGGGAGMGYSLAGFDVTGVDINPQGNYPFEFKQGDALETLENLTESGEIKDYAAVHASPPCQKYTRKQANWGRKRTFFFNHPDLLARTRKLLDAAGLPYVIENVPGAPIREDLTLCGTMFDLRIKKHRHFEANWKLPEAPRECDHTDTYNPWAGKGRSAEKLREAMGIDWLPISGGASRKLGYTGDLFNAIPPAYTQFIGTALLKQLNNNQGR